MSDTLQVVGTTVYFHKLKAFQFVKREQSRRSEYRL